MKKLLLSSILSSILLLNLFNLYSQENSTSMCALDNFISIARENNPDFDKQIEEKEKFSINFHKNKQQILTIPVVVHIVWNSSTDSIPDEQVYSQIDALNIDYMRLNADTVNTPSEFISISANPRIQFCLAEKDPDGNETTGITRTQSHKSLFALVSGDTSIWHTSLGGFDGWDPSKYLNIWVANISPAGGIGFWPEAVFPGHREGVVINHTFFGTTGTAIEPYNQGRTTTHEVGHYLNLYHLWGNVSNNSNCLQTDYCDDTPTQRTASQYCPSFPLTDICTNTYPGLNFMNFMDYPRDSCKNMFTVDQVDRMRNCLLGVRSSLLTSNSCSATLNVKQLDTENQLNVYPNPSTENITIVYPTNNSTLKIYNSLGVLWFEDEINYTLQLETINWPNGFYTVEISTNMSVEYTKLIISH